MGMSTLKSCDMLAFEFRLILDRFSLWKMVWAWIGGFLRSLDGYSAVEYRNNVLML